MGPRKKWLTDRIRQVEQFFDELAESKREGEGLIDEMQNLELKLQEHSKAYEGLYKSLQSAILETKDDQAWKDLCDNEDDPFWEVINKANDLLSKLRASREGEERRVKLKLEIGTKRVDEKPEKVDAEEWKREFKAALEKRMEAEMKALRLEMERGKERDPGKCNVKLPKLEIKPYSGDILGWSQFWDAFESTIHNNTTLTDVERFTYLKTKLEEGSEASDVVSGLSLTNDNYNTAVQLLKDRFGSKEKIISAHQNELIIMPGASTKLSSLKSTYDAIQKHLRPLANMEGEANIDSSLLLNICWSKIPKSVQAEMVRIRTDKKAQWTLNSFSEAIKEYISSMEFAEAHSAMGIHSGATSKQFTTTESLYTASKQRGLGRQDQWKRRIKCSFCNKSHFSDKCRKYPTVSARKERAIEVKCCMKCLRHDHNTGNCTWNITCFHCKQKHPSAFCEKSTRTISNLTCTANVGDKQVLLQSAYVEVSNPEYTSFNEAHIILDSASQKSYITESLATKLQLKKLGTENLAVQNFGSTTPKYVKATSAQVNLKTSSGEYIRVAVSIVPTISGRIQQSAIPQEIQKKLQRYKLADRIPKETKSHNIDILLGADYYCHFMKSRKKKIHDNLYLLDSEFGWIVTGQVSAEAGDEKQSNDTISMLTNCRGPIAENLGLKQKWVPEHDKHVPELGDLWNMESIGIGDMARTQKDDNTEALKIFNENIKYLADEGRYEVVFPFKEELTSLPNNYRLAYGRLVSLMKSLNKDKEILKRYNAVIKDQIEREMIEAVPDDEVDDDTVKHYIPHGAVIDETRATTKIRVVFDASAKTKKTNHSLNDLLYRGPVYIGDLCGVIFRFRLHEICVCSDLEKAFHMISLRPDMRNVCRFLWVKNLDQPVSRENLQIYRFRRVFFGAICSPMLLGATIDYHLEKHKDDYEMIPLLKQDIYVDNLITGTSCVPKALTLYKESKELFQKAAMNIREWTSNSEEFMSQIPVEDRSTHKNYKVLGMHWNQKNDTFSLQLGNTVEQPSTKRGILKEIAKFFDPMGFCSAITLRAKLLLQSLWRQEVTWDEPISAEDDRKWQEIKQDMKGYENIIIPRMIGGKNYKLIAFVDASDLAYSAAVYLTSQVGSKMQSHLIFSKTRLSPKRKMSIPRLELMAALIGCRCIRFIAKHIGVLIEKKVLFTDSKCVLYWIASKRDLPRFVQNRVREITSESDINFRFIGTLSNPSDLPTRGCSVDELKSNTLWWHGPSFLLLPESEWPVSEIGELDPITIDKIKSESPKILYQATSSHFVTGSVQQEVHSPFNMNIENFSSLLKLVRITAWAKRFVHNVKYKGQKLSGELSAHEIESAKMCWIKYVQKVHFRPEIHAIVSGGKNPLVYQLGLQLDDNGMIKCTNSRLDFSDLPERSIYPLLLPRKSHLTTLIVQDVHKQIMHSGVNYTLAKVRNFYWIPKGRAVVRNILMKCGVCVRWQGGPYVYPKMPELPKIRVQRAIVFQHTALDFLGPMYYRCVVDKEIKKAWICLLCCLVTRNIHLEVVKDNSSEQFLLCLRRFISIRNRPDTIISDRAPQHIVVQKTLKDAWDMVLVDPKVQSYVANQNITWKFLPAYSTWSGGYYERLVALTKQAARKSIGKLPLDYDQLVATVSEICSILNDRPLIQVTLDFRSGHVLRPVDFLNPGAKIGVPVLEQGQRKDPDFCTEMSTHKQLLQLWRESQKCLDQFWVLFRDLYLQSLRERKNEHKTPRVQSRFTPTVNSIVLIGDKTPRGSWRIAMITELHYSSDGQVRSATLRSSDGTVLSRPINKLYPLEVSPETTRENVANDNDQNSDRAEPRPVRAAAQKARSKISEYFDEKDNDSD